MRPALAAALLALSLAACGQPQPAPAPAPAETPPSGVDTKLSQEPIDAVPFKEAPPPAPVAPPKPKTEPVVSEPVAAAPVGEPGSCLAEMGEARSKRLVERCIAVSPATRPPCNSANPCDMIQGEIDRSCKLWARDGNPPAACKS